MTARQSAYVRTLVGQRLKSLGVASVEDAVLPMRLDLLDKRQKSTLIERLLAMPADPDDDMPTEVANADRKGINSSTSACHACGHTVEAGEGYYYGPFHNERIRWRVTHKAGQCSAEPPPPTVDTTTIKADDHVGLYSLDGETVLLYKTRQGRLGGKVWSSGKFVYQPGLSQRTLATGARLSEDETRSFAPHAEAAGHATGRCCFCGRDLTDERSAEHKGGAGYGPVCAAKYGLPWG